jgi:hypothetical protein
MATVNTPHRKLQYMAITENGQLQEILLNVFLVMLLNKKFQDNGKYDFLKKLSVCERL